MTGGGRLLWLLRHAKAAPAPPGGSDHDRPLAQRGLHDSAALGRLLASGEAGFTRDDLPQLVLASSARRTADTAERVASALGLPVDRRGGLYYGGAPIDEIRTVDDDVRSLMVVGHNPSMHGLVIELADDVAVSSFPTCALAVVRVQVGHWADVAAGAGELLRVFAPPY